MTSLTLSEIEETLSFCTTSEEKLDVVIDFGRTLAPFPEKERLPKNEIRGCASRVWLTCQNHVCQADSEAIILKGVLVMCLTYVAEKQTPEGVRAWLEKIGLFEMLTYQRRSGIDAFIQAIETRWQTPPLL